MVLIVNGVNQWLRLSLLHTQRILPSLIVYYGALIIDNRHILLDDNLAVIEVRISVQSHLPAAIQPISFKCLLLFVACIANALFLFI